MSKSNTMQKYKFTNKDKEIEVEVEKFGWYVQYQNGTTFKQFGDDGNYHRFSEIKLDEVVLFGVVDIETNKVKHIIIPNKNIQLFYFFRSIKPYYLDKFIRIYVFGFKNKNSDKKCYNFILPNGTVVSSSEDNIDLTKFNL